MTLLDSKARARSRREARRMLDSLNAPTEIAIRYRFDGGAALGRLVRKFALREMRRRDLVLP